MKLINKSLVLLISLLITSCSTGDLSSESLSSESSSSSITSSSSVHECEWDEPTYTWATDHTSLTATRVCKEDNSHVETETVNATSKITTAPSCLEKGVLTYTSDAFTNEAFKVQTYKEDISPLGHSYGDYIYDSTQGSCYHECEECHDKEYEECDLHYTGVDNANHKVTCSKCHHEYLEGHTWSATIQYISFAHYVGDDVVDGEAYLTCTICSYQKLVHHSKFEFEV